jgi:sucrose-6-phosphate hydrolase SacC (GH32 family)
MMTPLPTQAGRLCADDPFAQAAVAWHMATPTASQNYPVDLAVYGQARLGERLSGDEAAASLKRGGAGCAAVLEGGWLALDTHRARRLRPTHDALSLYVRAWVGPEGHGALFFSDFMALAIHPSGLAVGFLGVQTLAGKVFRELPLGFIERGRWLDLVLCAGGGRCAFYCNGALMCDVPLRQGLCAPFDDDLLVGAFRWCGPEPFGTAMPIPFSGCKVASVAVWHAALSEAQVAFLSGVAQIERSGVDDSLAQACADYNAFFDASVQKDVQACGELWRSLRAVADRDLACPAYHLTQPLGHIFDPCGAYFYGGKYHVFSYRNIFALLKYCSLDHYVSEDLVHWTQWPVAPWADCALDIYGIYLMNHFIDDEGTPRVLYTAQGAEGKFGILARSEDGLVSYTDKQAVLTRYHHDGHVWKEGDTWHTITTRIYKGTRADRRGDAVMLWTSPDLLHWQERGELFAQPMDALAPTGLMEFPYLLPFGDKEVLILGGRPVRYWVGHFDRQALRFIPDAPEGKLLDYANPFHCFNPLCVDQHGPGGAPRRIVMAMYAGIGAREPGWLPWNGVHAMPRALALEGDHLRQDPLPELQTLRGAHAVWQGITLLPGQAGYVGARGNTLELQAEFEPGTAQRFGLKVHVASDAHQCVRVYFDVAAGAFGVQSDSADAMPQGHGPAYIPHGQPVRLQVFLDRGLIEAFVNGQTCTTAAPEALRGCAGLDLFSEGGAARCVRLDVWEMQLAGV